MALLHFSRCVKRRRYLSICRNGQYRCCTFRHLLQSMRHPKRLLAPGLFLRNEKPLFSVTQPNIFLKWLLKFYFIMRKNIHAFISFLLRSANLINTSNFSKWRSWLKEFARSVVRPPILIGRQVQLIALSFFLSCDPDAHLQIVIAWYSVTLLYIQYYSLQILKPKPMLDENWKRKSGYLSTNGPNHTRK